MISDKTANIVIIVVTTMWVLNLLAGMLSAFGVGTWQPSDIVNGVFTTIMGGAFAMRTVHKGGDKTK